MEIKELENIITLKNGLILELEVTKKQFPNSQRVLDLANQAAEYEGRIAQALIDFGKAEKAIINLISQASCYVDAGRIKDSISTYNRILDHCSQASIKQWLTLQWLKPYGFFWSLQK